MLQHRSMHASKACDCYLESCQPVKRINISLAMHKRCTIVHFDSLHVTVVLTLGWSFSENSWSYAAHALLVSRARFHFFGTSTAVCISSRCSSLSSVVSDSGIIHKLRILSQGSAENVDTCCREWIELAENVTTSLHFNKRVHQRTP